ncbi:MAG: WG repeat-containing protein [Balneolaceae bacterium]|nr:WG repeat-containing protein [Balneolaceae bacterium]
MATSTNKGNTFGIQRGKMIMKRLFIFLILGLLSASACEVVDGISDNENTEITLPIAEVELFPVLLNGEWGYINKSGKMVLEPRYQNAFTFSDGLAIVRESWRWKYIDETGEQAFEGDFEDLRTFSEGKAAVRVDGRWGYINQNGNFIINPRFRGATSFSNDRAFVRSLDYRDYFYINEFGNPLDALNMPGDMDFIESGSFQEKRALVLEDGLYGYIDPTGNTVIDLQYSEALPFSDQLAAVLISDRWGFIDTTGTIAISPQFVSAGTFNDGLAPARKNSNQYGFIDKTGAFVIAEQFDEVRAFSEEFAPVRIGEKWTFVDLQGNQISEAIFDEVEGFNKGLARVITYTLNEENELEEEIGYINQTGNYVWFPTQ